MDICLFYDRCNKGDTGNSSNLHELIIRERDWANHCTTALTNYFLITLYFTFKTSLHLFWVGRFSILVSVVCYSMELHENNCIQHRPIKQELYLSVFCFYDILVYDAWMVYEMAYWTLSCGFGFLRPLWTCAGSNRECSQIEFAPLLARVCTILEAHMYVLGYDPEEHDKCVCERLFSYLQKGRRPAAVSQVFDDGNVTAQAPVHRTALIADQNPSVYTAPARVWKYKMM